MSCSKLGCACDGVEVGLSHITSSTMNAIGWELSVTWALHCYGYINLVIDHTHLWVTQMCDPLLDAVCIFRRHVRRGAWE